MELTEKIPTKAAHRPELRMLLVYTFIMVLGFTMLMPLVAVHFVSEIGFAATIVGIALAVRQFTQQGCSIFGGMLGDKFGIKPMIAAGVLLRALGFISLAWVDSVPVLFIALIISALGGALFEAPYQASIVVLTREEERPNFYILSNWVIGVATTVGPLLGAGLLYFDFQLVCLGAGACFLINFLIVLFYLPNIPPPPKEPDEKGNHGWRMVVRDGTFLSFVGLMMGYWFLSVQLNISFPLFVEKLTGSQESVGIMYALSAAITVVLQYPLVKWLKRYFSTGQVLVSGIVLMSLSTLAILTVQASFAHFLVLIALFAIGNLMTRPTEQTITAKLANPKAVATYMGFSAVSLAVGGGLGNFAGGWLYDLSRHSAAEPVSWLLSPWVIFSGCGLLTAIGVAVLLKVRKI